MYWKKKDGYVERPKHTSQIQMLEDRKYYKKPDIAYLSDLIDEL